MHTLPLAWHLFLCHAASQISRAVHASPCGQPLCPLPPPFLQGLAPGQNASPEHCSPDVSPTLCMPGLACHTAACIAVGTAAWSCSCCDPTGLAICVYTCMLYMATETHGAHRVSDAP